MRMLAAALLFAVSLAAQGGDQREGTKNPFSNDTQAVAAGREIFLEACSACHGMSGQGGHGPSLVTGREVRRAPDARLFASIKNGVAGTDMPPLPRSDSDIWKVVSYLRSLGAPAVEMTLPGEPAAGRQIFFGKGGCSGCHMIRGQGGQLGPDLSNVGARLTVEDLREAIVDPNASVAQGFEAVTVTSQGTEIKGVAKVRTNYLLAVQDKSGKLHRVSPEAASILVLDESWMPNDYAERLSEPELTDLLTFLGQLAIQERPPAADR